MVKNLNCKNDENSQIFQWANIFSNLSKKNSDNWTALGIADYGGGGWDVVGEFDKPLFTAVGAHLWRRMEADF